MSARYLIRLDDACDTMDRARWDLMEHILGKHGVKPIVAVIPSNHDRSLMFEARDAAFWDKVRGWALKGWSVAMHGYTHVMHSTQSKLVLPFYKRSEFAGLELESQAEKVRSAWALFLAQGVEPKIWIAPAHCFDLLTLQALRRETSIRVISDGIAWDTYFEHEFYWIPQQMWGLAERSWGLWTVCLHPNTMNDAAMRALDTALDEKYLGRMTCFQDLQMAKRKKSGLSRLYSLYFWWQWGRAGQTS